MSAPHEDAERFHAVEREIASLRSRCQNLERALASIEAQCEEAQAVMAHTHGRYEQLRSDLIEARRGAAAAGEALNAVGPTGMAIARRLARLSLRFPAGGWLARRSLQGAALVRDKVRGRGRAGPSD